MHIKNTHSLDITGSLQFAPTDPPRPFGKYTYQRVQRGHGNVAADPSRRLQLRLRVTGFDPMTPAQLARRAIFRAAIAEWHTLTPEQKKIWNRSNPGRKISGLNSLLSARLKAT